jgi:hypothetical protein
MRVALPSRGVFLSGMELLLFTCLARCATPARVAKIRIVDFQTDKARYDPGESVTFRIRLPHRL